MKDEPAIILLSGGLDSVTALAWAQAEGYAIRAALSFHYGQRHERELASAAAIAAHYGVPHQIVELAPIRGSRLTGGGTIPQGRDLAGLTETIAPTYVPNRNMILLAYAAAHALLGDATQLIGGWNAADGANYPDCRDEFLLATETALRLATLRDFTIVRPLISDGKAAIVRRALALGAPIPLTWTCYVGATVACGRCDACQLRVAAFREVGVRDPIPYAVALDWTGCRPYAEIG
ncbi:MAG: 7-cyano-7-deazaguanine synthase QueC [Chloroflexota bacterium]|nr:7-cyano-7-deazaguanine synthase QueC [Chloroflexota bacterium]